MRTLWVDARAGLDAAGLLAALVDAGVAPSPILHDVAGLGLPVEMRLEAGGVAFHPPMHGVLVRPGEVRALFERAGLPPAARAIASDALGRVLLAEAGRGDALAHPVEAGVLLALAGVGLALPGLDAARVEVSRIGVGPAPAAAVLELLGEQAEALDFDAGATTVDGAALALTLASDALGLPEPAWRGPVARGRSAGGVALALGRTA